MFGESDIMLVMNESLHMQNPLKRGTPGMKYAFRFVLEDDKFFAILCSSSELEHVAENIAAGQNCPYSFCSKS